MSGISYAGLFGQGRCLIICRFAFGFGFSFGFGLMVGLMLCSGWMVDG
jgi:hypothetical protein